MAPALKNLVRVDCVHGSMVDDVGSVSATSSICRPCTTVLQDCSLPRIGDLPAGRLATLLANMLVGGVRCIGAVGKLFARI